MMTLTTSFRSRSRQFRELPPLMKFFLRLPAGTAQGHMLYIFLSSSEMHHQGVYGYIHTYSGRSNTWTGGEESNIISPPPSVVGFGWPAVRVHEGLTVHVPTTRSSRLTPRGASGSTYYPEGNHRRRKTWLPDFSFTGSFVSRDTLVCILPGNSPPEEHNDQRGLSTEFDFSSYSEM